MATRSSSRPAASTRLAKVDLDPREMGAAIVRTARIRSEGTRNLVRAALAAGANRLVAQTETGLKFQQVPNPRVGDRTPDRKRLSGL